MWRIISLEEHDAPTNMAIDEAISESVRENLVPPTIRFYAWKPSAISIGYFQKLNEEVDIDSCKKSNVDIVRRWTGGGAVLHENEITYSVIAPESFFPKDIIQSYHIICGWVIDALKRLNIQSEFHPINDVLVNNKKISGNAQTRRRNILIQHGTILFDVNIDKMFSLLKVKDIKIKDKLIKNVKERVTSIKSINPEITKASLANALQLAFTSDKEFEIRTLTETEKFRVEELKKEKYSNQDWTAWR